MTANPWVVIPRLTWMPIEAILRGSGVHTPVSPSRVPASTPKRPSAADQRRLEQPHVAVHVVAKGRRLTIG